VSGDWTITLAADPADVLPGVLGAALLVAIVIVAIVISRDQIQKRQRREREAAMIGEQQRQQSVHREREEKAYQQHTVLNDLHARKVELETRLLQAQADNAARDQRVREQNEEYHRLMVQKAQLEIQSLKLHIREQQKRNEDFSSGYEEE
jgi:hypothetical protein